MTRYQSVVSLRWVVQAVHIPDPPVNSAAALALLAKKYFGEDKSIYTDFRMLRFRRKWIKQLMQTPDSEGGLTCSMCGRKGLLPSSHNKNKVATLDHIRGIGNGGKWNDTSNFRVACWKCNQKENAIFQRTKNK